MRIIFSESGVKLYRRRVSKESSPRRFPRRDGSMSRRSRLSGHHSANARQFDLLDDARFVVDKPIAWVDTGASAAKAFAHRHYTCRLRKARLELRWAQIFYVASELLLRLVDCQEDDDCRRIVGALAISLSYPRARLQ